MVPILPAERRSISAFSAERGWMDGEENDFLDFDAPALQVAVLCRTAGERCSHRQGLTLFIDEHWPLGK